MNSTVFKRLLIGVALLALPLLGGCATAPATGKTIFTGGLNEEAEAELGRKEHDKILKQFGGAYDDPALAAYIGSLGRLLAKTSELADREFTFTVLDTPTVNAFALPGGYVYVTRGLLALAENEAEVAGVLAHEIGHVTARHAAERYGDAVTATALNLGVAILLGGQAAHATSGLSQIVLRGFSRDQEFEADTLGVRYLSRTGHDPKAMATFLSKLQAHSRLQATLAGRPGAADEFSLLQTHPRTADRVEQAIRQAATRQVRDPVVARDIYLRKIDGMLYGDNPEHGMIRGRRFAHPKLGFVFDVPEGFRLINSAKAVIARGPEGAAILFDGVRKKGSGPIRAYLTESWGKSLALRDVETLRINGLEAATGRAQVDTRRGRFDVRLVAFDFDAESIYRFIFITPPNLTAGLSRGLRDTTYSFRRLGEAEAKAYPPLRLRLAKVRQGDTAAAIAKRMPFDDYRLERFLVLNGLSSASALRAGQTVKIVTD